MPVIQPYIESHPTVWEASGMNQMDFIAGMLSEGHITPVLADELRAEVTREWRDIQETGAPPPEFDKRIGSSLWGKVSDHVLRALEAMWKSLWRFVKDTFRDLWDLIKKYVVPPIVKALQKVNAGIDDLSRKAYQSVKALMQESGPITPELAPGLAVKLYGVAMGAGMAAHGIAVGCELLHPLKTLGVHQLAALVGDFASFGRIAAATTGVLTGIALGRPMTYAANDMMQNKIPDDKLLIEFRSKREIDYGQFEKAMRYQGFNDAWIKIIERWQWKDPRMFELMRVADVGIDQGPPPSEEMWWFNKFGITGEKLKDWWLYRKLMRAGYEDVDLPVLIATIHRRESAFAQTYVRTAMRKVHRWGYATDEWLDDWMEELDLRPEARKWVRWTQQMELEYRHKHNLETHLKLAYRNDLMTEDDLSIGLSSLDMPDKQVDILVNIERVRKAPKVRREVAKEVEKPLASVQKKYMQLYRELYRKGVIDDQTYLSYLLQLGITEELAEVTVSLEEAKKFKPAPAP